MSTNTGQKPIRAKLTYGRQRGPSRPVSFDHFQTIYGADKTFQQKVNNCLKHEAVVHVSTREPRPRPSSKTQRSIGKKPRLFEWRSPTSEVSSVSKQVSPDSRPISSTSNTSKELLPDRRAPSRMSSATGEVSPSRELETVAFAESASSPARLEIQHTTFSGTSTSQDLHREPPILAKEDLRPIRMQARSSMREVLLLLGDGFELCEMLLRHAIRNPARLNRKRCRRTSLWTGPALEFSTGSDPAVSIRVDSDLWQISDPCRVEEALVGHADDTLLHNDERNSGYPPMQGVEIEYQYVPPGDAICCSSSSISLASSLYFADTSSPADGCKSVE